MKINDKMVVPVGDVGLSVVRYNRALMNKLVLKPGWDMKYDSDGSVIVYRKTASEALTTADLEEMESDSTS